MAIEEDTAPGWDAIDAALAALYPGEAPKHYGTLIGYRLGGPDPLDGIGAWWRETPVPHWHFVTYGFSELYAKESEDPGRSGHGFELTFRLAASPGDEPPAWVLDFLQNLARYVFRSGNVFAAGHYMSANGPIALGTGTAISSIAFAADPELPEEIATVHGRVAFLQAVGLTDDEALAAKRWNAAGVLEALAPRMPLWITDLARGSLLGDVQIAATVEAGVRRDGSRTGFLYVDTLGWKTVPRLLRRSAHVLTLGARQADELLLLLPGRLPFQRPLRLCGPDAGVRFEPAARNEVAVEDGMAVVRMTPDAVHDLCRTLQPLRGRYGIDALPNLAIVVEPTLVRAADGSVAETIG